MKTQLGRRRFLVDSAAAASALAVPRRVFSILRGAPRKLRLGVIGVGNRGAANLRGVAGEDVIALCDVDARFLARAAKRFPRAREFRDYREMLDLRRLDAVVISAPDHHHAPAAELALARGLDVYCEKPLTHTVAEARGLAALAQKKRAVTQMGTQIHAGDNYRRVVELARAGAIGPVGEVHVFCSSRSWGGGERPDGEQPVPDTLAWDLWLGPAPARPYHDGYHPAHWRRFWDFGGGNLGDMGCHYMDLAFWALELERPVTVRAEPGEVHPETAPRDIVVHYAFAARDGRGPVALTWYGGAARPPLLEELGLQGWRSAVLFVGSEGRYLIADYTKRELGPKAAFESFAPPPKSIPDSVGHHREWLEACREHGETTCAFAYAAPLTEAVLLGNVSYRLGGEVLAWDGDAGRVTDLPGAASLLARPRRDGW